MQKHVQWNVWYVVIAIIDYAWQKYRYEKNLRMSVTEVKQEAKQQELAPELRAAQRRRQRDAARRRMLADVPTADVIITNPTHYAVALKYEGGAMAAPRCVAKGVDALALRIRALAEEHGVPVVENPPLARALYAAVDVDGEIPVEHYKAVAQIIGFIMRQRPAK